MTMAFVMGLLAVTVYVWCIEAGDHSLTYSRSEGAVGNEPRWMSALSGTLPITELSIPGTHDTMADDNGDVPDCQTMHLRPQLDSGIRALDIRLKLIDGGRQLWTYHGVVKLSENFETVLDTVIAFLSDNPSEFVIMNVQAEDSPDYDNGYTATDFQKAIEQRYSNNKYKDHLYLKAMNCKNGDCSNIPTVDEVRGKIVILRSHSGNDGITGPYMEDCAVVESKYYLRNNWELYDKWTKDENYAIKINGEWKAQALTGSIKGFRINWLNGSGGSFPYFVASGHSSSQQGAPRLYTGHLSDRSSGDRKWPDFPRRDCVWWFWSGELCSVDFEGINRLFYDHVLGSSSIEFTGIVMMDFPGQGLISRIIAKNAFGTGCNVASFICDEKTNCKLDNGRWSGGCCTTEFQCLEGEGDCDSDNDCAGPLVCGTDNCGSPFQDTHDCCTAAPERSAHFVARGRKSYYKWTNGVTHYCHADDNDVSEYFSNDDNGASDKIRVSCCSANGQTGWRPKKGNHDPQCFDADWVNPQSYDEAKAFCESAGYRLCTLQEMLADKTRGKGCWYDLAYNWVSDECTDPVTAEAAIAVSGGAGAAVVAEDGSGPDDANPTVYPDGYEPTYEALNGIRMETVYGVTIAVVGISAAVLLAVFLAKRQKKSAGKKAETEMCDAVHVPELSPSDCAEVDTVEVDTVEVDTVEVVTGKESGDGVVAQEAERE